MSEKPVALVTGGATGIGAACCRALAAKGFRVAIHYRSSDAKAKALLAEIGDGLLLQADLADVDSVEAMVTTLQKEAGRLDVLVNNAGHTVNAAILTMSIQEFDDQRSTNRGAWYLTKRVLRLFMLRKGQGRIINISSVVASAGNPGQIVYTMEKAAVEAFTKSLAKELSGRDILVNAVAPGWIDTDMTAALPADIRDRILAQVPLGRMGKAEEVADVVAYLSTGGSYIQGTVIHVNGGLYGG